MRYFFISYSHTQGFGSLSLASEDFPSTNSVELTVKEQYPDIESPTIISLYEFRNKEDFDRFNDNEPEEKV